jgi:toxin ParE1/3/4
VKLRYDNRAIHDLDKIFNYIAERDPSAATRVIARVRTLAEQSAKKPQLGRKTDIKGLFGRSVVTYPYLIFYAVRPSEVVILHVRHTARREADPSEAI